MTINTIIIEDEDHAAAKLERTLSRLSDAVNVLARLDSVETAVAWLRENQADLIFCDIHLGDANSFDIFKKVEVKTPVIFITAYNQYAIQAFEVNSVDYLLKPIRLESLEKAIERYKERQLNSGALPIDQLLSALESKREPDYQKRFMVSFGEEIRAVNAEEIAYFFSEGKYTYLITHENKEYLVDYTLDELMNHLDADTFFKISRQYIVSLSSIHKMYAYPKGRVKVVLKPQEKKEAIVSIEKSPQFKKWLNR